MFLGYNTGMKLDKQRLIESIKNHGIRHEEVLRAVSAVPREMFVPPKERSLSYYDHPLPIGCGQTISQPFTVAYMAQLLDVQPGDTVLEIGCGSGYNAAVLQEIAGDSGKVYSVDRIPELVEQARRNLEEAGYSQVEVLLHDGKQGLPDYAPFQRIMVTAQGPVIPEALVRDLDDFGYLVMPISSGNGASMTLLIKQPDGNHTITTHGSFVFVPLQ